jgi:2-polyprenyl-6-methoxyphenol hydroxylase-like FAD-dependent oxidoreductase
MQDATRIRFDAVIVGAGPAGSACAILLARAGWSVALVERQRFPRHMACGECFSAGNLPLLQTLGVADAFEACAGPELRQLNLLRGTRSVTAELPAADHLRYRWGRAIGREALDTLLLDQARAGGVVVLQPWSVQAILGIAGAWHCELRAVESTSLLRLRAALVIDAQGSWDGLPPARPQRRLARSTNDLFAFKASFRQASLREGVMHVMSMAGGYGGMVVAGGGVTTVACCIRRDRLNDLRGESPGLRAGDAVQAWLQRECMGVRLALQNARRDGPWLASRPLNPGVRLDPRDETFKVGNAAGEVYPLFGDGLNMALQSASLLCSRLLGERPAAAAPIGTLQAEIQRGYAADWRREFLPRLRLASALARLSMQPKCSAALMQLAAIWPGLLTRGARWGGQRQETGGAGRAVMAGRAVVRVFGAGGVSQTGRL